MISQIFSDFMKRMLVQIVLLLIRNIAAPKRPLEEAQAEAVKKPRLVSVLDDLDENFNNGLLSAE